jgi:uncharacterized protein (TIGR02271 family)
MAGRTQWRAACALDPSAPHLQPRLEWRHADHRRTGAQPRKRVFMATKETVLQWRGQNLVGSDGGKVGKIEEIYLDAETNEPEWALVHTGMFGSKSSFVPIANAQDDDGSVKVPFAKSQVTDAPKVDPNGQLTQQQEAELYGHYGMDYGEQRSDSGLPDGRTNGDPTPGGSPGVVGNDVSGSETDDAMTRSEEELRVGTTQREAGRARLRKYVVTENVTQSVPVSREEVRIEREPITDANRDAATSGADLSEEEHEVVLHEEEVVVEKRAVPKERVRLDKDTVTEQREVSEGVRKEQVELIDGEGKPAEGIDGVRGTDAGITR